MEVNAGLIQIMSIFFCQQNINLLTEELLTWSFPVFLSPNRIHSKSTKNQSNDEYYEEKNCKLVHNYMDTTNRFICQHL